MTARTRNTYSDFDISEAIFCFQGMMMVCDDGVWNRLESGNTSLIRCPAFLCTISVDPEDYTLYLWK